MTQGRDLRKIEQIAYKDTMIDGFTEMFLGVLLLLGALSIKLPGFIGLIALFPIIFAAPLIERLKRKYTYPRIGYVKIRTENGAEIGFGILKYSFAVTVVLAILSFFIFSEASYYERIYRSLPLFLGLSLTGAFTYLHSKSGDKIAYFYIIVSMAVAITITPFEFNWHLTSAIIYLMAMGIFFFFAGIAIFMSFNRRYPLPAETKDE